MPIFNEKFILNAPKKFSNLLTVKCAGITNEDSNYFISRSESDSIIIEYVLFGKGYIEVENKKYSLYKGDCFVLQSNQAHKYYADKKSPFKKVFFSFNGDFITVLLKLYNLTENPIIAPIADKKPFEQLLYLLSNNINDKNIEGVLCLKLHEIILQVKNNYSTQNFISQDDNLSISNQIKLYIENNLNNKFLLDDLSKTFYLSKAHLIKIFKDNYNTTPYSYYMQCKLDISKKLLENTKLKIDEISARMSFTDSQHFSKLFKKVYGISPMQYRKSKKQD